MRILSGEIGCSAIMSNVGNTNFPSGDSFFPKSGKKAENLKHHSHQPDVSSADKSSRFSNGLKSFGLAVASIIITIIIVYVF